ncbi:uncharacterized protein LOC119554975 [Drosophila subpulchrella]|uniref:uncharacterized protein LOC119554975 n=1 Tax=Drosophila subpulchrella TaxID=1486046 RepID=UPI0018A14964|nr:uncharacterized protein LOC119554975 [Drosophila subpulchrella]
MNERLAILAIDIVLYCSLMPDLPIWAFVLLNLLTFNNPLQRFAVVFANAFVKWYLLPFCEEWIAKNTNEETD